MRRGCPHCCNRCAPLSTLSSPLLDQPTPSMPHCLACSLTRSEMHWGWRGSILLSTPHLITSPRVPLSTRAHSVSMVLQTSFPIHAHCVQRGWLKHLMPLCTPLPWSNWTRRSCNLLYIAPQDQTPKSPSIG